jgi:hypothetical protein
MVVSLILRVPCTGIIYKMFFVAYLLATSAIVQVVSTSAPLQPIATRNLVRNPSIEEYDTNTFKPIWWQPFISDYIMTSKRRSHTGKSSLTFNLYRSKWVGCGQLVYIGQTSIARDVEVSGWVSAYDLEVNFALYSDVRYVDGTSDQDYTLHFGKGTFSWRHQSMILKAKKPIHSVMIYVVMQASTSMLGSAYLDDVSLIQLPINAVKDNIVPLLPLPSEVGKPKGTTSSGLPVASHWCVDGQVCDTDLTKFHMHNYFLTASNKPSKNDITLVTQLSPDRLHRIQQLAKVWNGPISASVYVGHDTYNGVLQILSLWKTSELVRLHVDIHLVSLDSIGTKHEHSQPYPINALRNLAWQYSRTNLLFLLDVDFIVSSLFISLFFISV